MRTNYHTHTERCGHADGFDETFVYSAIEGGYEVLGFADHTPWPFADGYSSSIRMDIDELDGYVSSIRSLKEKYKDKIEIKIGLECEYYTDHLGWLREQKERLQLDYLLLGNHFPYREQRTLYSAYIRTHEELDLYMRSSIEAMMSGLYECFAHPDLFMHRYPKVDKHCLSVFRRLAAAARELNVAMEFNVQVPFHRELWEVVAEESPNVIVGLDAHSYNAFSRPERYDNAVAKLKELGINPIYKL